MISVIRGSVFLAIALVPLQTYSIRMLGLNVSPIDGVTMILAFALIIHEITKPSSIRIGRQALLCLTVLFSMHVISTIFNGNRPSDWVAVSSLGLKYSLLFGILASIRTESDLRSVLILLMLGGFFNSVAAISQWLSGRNMDFYPAVHGLYQSRNEMLIYLVPSTIASLSFLRRGDKLRLLGVAVFVLSVWATVVCQGRMGLAVLTLFLALYIWIETRSVYLRYAALLTTLLSLIVSVIALPQLLDFSYSTVFKSEIGTDTPYLGDQIRFALLEHAVNLAKEHWVFGMGPTGFETESSYFVRLAVPTDREIQEGLNPHSSYLSLLVGVGVVGLLASLVLLTTVISGLTAVLRRSVILGRHQQVVLLCAGSLVLLLTTVSAVYDYPLWIYLGLTLGLSTSRRRRCLP